MNPLDKIISQSVIEVLEKDLGKRTYKKIEKEVSDVYGLSLLDAAKDFSKLDFVLRKFFGPHVVKIELQIFKKILSFEKNNRIGSDIIINDPNVAKTVFEAYGDPAKKIILEILLNEPKSIPQAITESKLPQASAYRRAKELIKDGLVTMTGFAKATDGRKVNEYETTFGRARFDIQGEKLSVIVKLQNKFFKDSYALNTIAQSL